MSSEPGETTTGSGPLGAGAVGRDLAEREALREVKRRLFGTAPGPVKLDRYCMLRKLGSGGLGVVYLAHDPELDRQVAIKLMRAQPSHRSSQVARFTREARALAKISHPNVVEVFDVGEYVAPLDWPLDAEAPASGVYIAMEYVDGGSLREWLRGEPRRWRTVLDVLEAAGRGLAAAHHAGLCHRDFKPANVLIGGDGRPRVLDFGLARPLQHSDAAVTEGGEPDPSVSADASLTGTGRIVGTPAYMAPEQHRGEPVSPATDQYAFCVTAFEALYGRRPFTQKTIQSLAAAKQDEEIEPPADTRGVPPAVYRVIVRGLARKPEERHPSMEALIDALRRAHRRRVGWWAALPVVALAVGVAWMATGRVPSVCETGGDRMAATWPPRARGEIEAAFEATGRSYAAVASTRVLSQLDAYAEAWLTAHQEACATARRDELEFDRGLACLANQLTAMTTLVAALREADGELVLRGPTLATSLPPPSECLGGESGPPLPEDPQLLDRVAQSRDELIAGSMQRRAGRYAQARDAAQAVLESAGEIGFAPLEAEALVELGTCEHAVGDAARAEEILTDAFWLAERTGHHRVAAAAAGQLAFVVGDAPQRRAEAEKWAEHAAAAMRRSDAPPRQFAQLLAVTSSVKFRAGDLPAAIADARRAAAMYEQEETDDRFATALANLGGALAAADEYDEAEVHLRRSLDLRERLLGPDHPDVAQSLNSLAVVFDRRGEFERVIEMRTRALRIWTDSRGADHPLVAMVLGNLASTYARLGKLDEAEEKAREALATRERILPAGHVDIGYSQINLAEILLGQSKVDEAAALAQSGATLMTEAVGAEHEYSTWAQLTLGQVLLAQEEYERAREVFDALTQKLDPSRGRQFGASQASLGAALLGLGRTDEAIAALEKAVQLLADYPSELPEARATLARALEQRKTAPVRPHD